MSKTYTTCIGMRGERTARGGNNGCRASVQAYDGSVIIRNWYDGDTLMVRVGTTKDSDHHLGIEASERFEGTFKEFCDALNLLHDIKTGAVSITRHRAKSNKQLQLERLLGVK